MSELTSPHKLTPQDNREGFCSGADELDEWLKRFAMQNQKANNAITYVTTLDDYVLGYYSLCSAGISQEQVPEVFGKNRPKDIPCILLARLAVDRRAKKKGVGRGLLRDAILRSYQAADTIGAACLLIHCRDEQAKKFYMHNADFLQSPIDELHLILPIKHIKKLLERP